MALDTATLMTVATGITGLLGVFLLLLWLQERNVRALAWWGAAYLVGASAVTFWSSRAPGSLVAMELPNALLFIACGMIWTGARLFHGRTVRPLGVLAGAIVWFVAVQFPDFAGSGHARVVLSSLVIAAYAFMTAYDLGRERRRELASSFRSIVIPLLHGAVFLAPIPLSLRMTAGSSADGLFALFALEIMLYVVGTAFIVVLMAKERVVLVHRTAAMTDQLTGLFNRRAFLEAADTMIAQRGRKSLPVSVLLFDLDHFKSINDRFGHAVGDDALKVFARVASGNMRATDVVGRLGGEEFAAILPGSASDAMVVAERVRGAFQAAGAQISGHAIGATVSIGAASAVPPVEFASLLVRADAALYRAKGNGRNRTEVAAEGPERVDAPTQPISALGGAVAAAQ
jgi:diguanylate cyclase (GGDEF)-like protein